MLVPLPSGWLSRLSIFLALSLHKESSPGLADIFVLPGLSGGASLGLEDILTKAETLPPKKGTGAMEG